MKKLLILVVSFFVTANVFSVLYDSGVVSLQGADICPKVCAQHGGWYHEGTGIMDNSPNLFCDCTN